jgi:hypothetical protein
MKKLFFLLTLVVGFSISTKAQHGFATKIPTVAGDSLVNVDTVFKSIQVTAGYSALNIQVNLKKGTGTLTGKVYLLVSNTGTDFQLTDSASYVATSTTSAFTPVYTHTAQFAKLTPGWVYYELEIVSTGKLASTPVNVYYTTRKYGTSTL